MCCMWWDRGSDTSTQEGGLNENAQGSETVAYLNTDWVDAANVTTTAYNGSVSNSLLTCGYTYTYPWGYYTPHAKITLTLSEVEHLRKCAKKDAKLKAALQKIAPHIEVVIDFP